MTALGWVDRALEATFGAAGDPTGAAVATPEGASLSAALRDAADGGKRFRPALVAAAHDGLGGRRADAVPPVAAGVELLHTAFVVHDDVIDGDTTRRGRATVPERFRSEAAAAGATARDADVYGTAGAVLTGDLALSAAVRAVATAPAPRPVVDRMLDLVDETLALTASGELADVRFATHRDWPSLPEVLSAEERKTAVYSFSLPLQLGAVLADAEDSCVEAMSAVGRHVGLAFQLRDDLIGVFGDEQVTGKSTLSDLREGKRTALIVHARSTPGWADIAPHWGDPELTEDGARRVRHALEACGSRAFVEGLVADCVRDAERCGDGLGVPVDLLTWLGGLCLAPTGAPVEPAATGAA